jgi:hypothetical protein
MSDTNARPGSNRKSPRQLLTAVSEASRKLRIAGLTGVITLAGTAALVAAPAAASASTVNPNCAVPIGHSWELDSIAPLYPPSLLPLAYHWSTTYNGVLYEGTTLIRIEPNSLPQGNGVCYPVG